ncbi:tol protein, partial [Colletotrichum asianum]
SSRISIFRLIDVTQRAVVRLSNVDITSLHYVALSYVWENDIDAQEQAVFEYSWSADGIVSKTIEDVIDLTKLLGLQYIWVDALCIVQDDIPDKSHHLAFMDQVYRYAEVTVIAASGKDANAGLPGLHEPRRIQQRVFKIIEATPDTNELCLITAPDIRPAWKYNYLEGSEWSSRGWTLQEKVMSRRTLIFTDTEVYWSCRGAKWQEGMYAETNLTKPTFFASGAGSGFLGAEVADVRNSSPWDDLQFQMADFSSRNSSVDGDAYSAFSGILQEFSDLTGERFLWAIPASRFEIGLCWHRQWKWGIISGTHLTRRTGLSTLPSTTLNCNVSFPSWSWLGWKGHIQMCFSDQYRETG